MTVRELGQALLGEALNLLWVRYKDVNDDTIVRVAPRLIWLTLQRAEASNFTYSANFELLDDHRDALWAIMQLVQAPQDFIHKSDYEPLAVNSWQPVLVEALRCCIHGTGSDYSTAYKVGGRYYRRQVSMEGADSTYDPACALGA